MQRKRPYFTIENDAYHQVKAELDVLELMTERPHALVPLPESGHRHADTVLLWDAPSGTRLLNKDPRPVFDALMLLEASEDAVYRAYVWTPHGNATASPPQARSVRAHASRRAAGQGNCGPKVTMVMLPLTRGPEFTEEPTASDVPGEPWVARPGRQPGG